MLIEFCIPVHNEDKIIEKNILKLFDYCENIFKFDWRIVAIINGSSDQSLNVCKKLSVDYNKIFYYNIVESGRGNALKEYWLKSEADILCYMDSDLAVSLDNISNLIFPIINNKADLTIGSRLISGADTNRNFVRELLSRCYNLLSRIIVKHNFKDLQCGFKAIKKDVFIAISPHILDKKWFFDTELVILTNLFNYRVLEIAVDWKDQRFSRRKSKVNLIKDSIKFIFDLLKLRIYIKNIKK